MNKMKMKKEMMFVLILLVLGTLVIAQNETEADNCSGFFNSIKCFLFGDSERRVGDEIE